MIDGMYCAACCYAFNFFLGFVCVCGSWGMGLAVSFQLLAVEDALGSQFLQVFVV